MTFRKSNRFLKRPMNTSKSFCKALFITALSFLFTDFILLAQPNITWENAIGGTGYDELRCLQATPDGGMILGCTSPSSELTSNDISEPSNVAGDYWIVKMNADGTIAWDRRMGGSDFESAQEIQSTSDGGYIIGGFSRSDASGNKSQDNFGPAGTSDIWVAKLNAIGDIQWEAAYGGDGVEELYHIQELFDGSFIIGGSSSSGISGTKTVPNFGEQDFYAIKIDANGNQLWDRAYGGTVRDVVQGLDVGLDGSLYFGGYSESTNDGNKTDPTFSPGKSDYWIVKTDANGNKIWDKAFGGDSWDQIRNIKVISDGNIIIGGFSKSGITGNKTTETYGEEDMWVLKLTPAGTVLWQQNYGGDLKEECTQVSETSCGELLLGGFSRSSVSGNKTANLEGNHDYWIVKTDYLGNKMWDESFGGDGPDVLYDFKRAADGGFLLGGVSYSDGTGDRMEPSLGPQDVWVLKLEIEPATMDSTFLASGSCSPMDTGLVVNIYFNNFQCDSVVLDTVKLLESDTTQIVDFSCSPLDTGEVITFHFNAVGCDSLVIVKTNYLQADTTEIENTSCSPLDTGEVVTFHFNADGCDSLVFTQTTLIQSYETFSSTSSCDPSSVGLDTIWMNSVNGCDSLIIEETVFETLNLEYFTEDPLCFESSEGLILIDTVLGGIEPYMYSLNNGVFTSDSVFNNLTAGTYFINVLDADGCEYRQEVNIENGQNFQLIWPEEITLSLGDSLWLDPAANASVASFIWNQNAYLRCDTCLQQFVKPTTDTRFELELISENGCSANGFLNVVIDNSKKWYTPNAFSPNDDGNNDVFKIYFDESVESITDFKVVNRWGSVVYDIERVDQYSNWGWDGKIKGKQLNPGVFIYIGQVNFTDGTSQLLKGDITLMR